MLTIAKLRQRSVSYSYVDTERSALAAAVDAWTAGGGLGEYYSEAETRLPVWLSAGRDVPAALELSGVERVGENADLDAVTRWLDEGQAPCGATGRAFSCASVHPHQREGSIRYTAADLITEERTIIELVGGGC